MNAQNIIIVVGAALAVALNLLDLILRSRRGRPISISWGFCWTCQNILGDDAEIIKIANHAYVPICPICARKSEYRRYRINHAAGGKND